MFRILFCLSFLLCINASINLTYGPERYCYDELEIPGLEQCDSDDVGVLINLDVCFDEGNIFIIDDKEYDLIYNTTSDIAYFNQVLCFKGGEMSERCTARHYLGLSVNGSSAYCSNNTCKTYKECYCEFVQWDVTARYNPQGRNSSCSNVTDTQLIFKHLGSSYDLLTRQRRMVGSEVSVFVEVDEDDHFVIYRFTSVAERTTYISKGEFTMEKELVGKNQVIELPEDMFASEGYINVKIVQDTELIYDESFHVEAEVKCTIKDCIFCSHFVDNYNCQPTSYKVLYIITMVFFILALVCIFPAVFASLMYCMVFVWYKIYWCFRVPAKMFCLKTVRRLRKMGQDMEKEVTDMEEVTIDNDSEVELSSRKRNRDKFNILMPTGAALLLLFLIAVPVESTTCNSGDVLVAEMDQCTSLNTTHNTCQASFNGEITIGHAGLTTCVTIRAKTGEVIDVVDLSYAISLNVGVYKESYTTCKWTGDDRDSSRCNTFNCDDTKCTDLENEGTPTDAYGELNYEGLLSRPGKTGCRKVCDSSASSIACGCIAVFPNCWYYRYTMKPDDTIEVRVYERLALFEAPLLTISSENLGKSALLVKHVEVAGVNFRYDGELLKGISEDENLENLAVVYKDGKVTGEYVGKFSAKGSPEAENVGDWQGALGSCKNPKADILTSDPAREIIMGEAKGTISYHRSGVEKMLSGELGNLLPYNSGLTTWKVWNETHLYSLGAGAQAIKIHMFTTQPVSFAVKKTSSSPTADFDEIDGCYGTSAECPTGFIIKFSARARAAPGFVPIYAETTRVRLATSSIYLSSDEKDFTVNAYTELNDVDFELRIGTQEDSDTIDVVGRLTKGSMKIPNGTFWDSQHGEAIDTEMNDDDEDFRVYNPIGWLDHMLTGSAHWWEWLLGIIFLILIIIIVIALMPVAIQLLGVMVIALKKVFKYMKGLFRRPGKTTKRS